MTGGRPRPPWTASGQTAGTDLAATDFAARLLHALQETATRSRQAHAELGTALRLAGLPLDHVRIRAALLLLLDHGYVGKPLALSDGGLLLTAGGRWNGQANARRRRTTRRHPDGTSEPPAPSANVMPSGAKIDPSRPTPPTRGGGSKGAVLLLPLWAWAGKQTKAGRTGGSESQDFRQLVSVATRFAPLFHGV
jgi:hypothetical protein